MQRCVVVQQKCVVLSYYNHELFSATILRCVILVQPCLVVQQPHPVVQQLHHVVKQQQLVQPFVQQQHVVLSTREITSARQVTSIVRTLTSSENWKLFDTTSTVYIASDITSERTSNSILS